MAVTQEYPATGKRKSAVARVWLRPGTGKMTVNNRELADYFPRPTSRMVIAQPFDLTGRGSDFDVMAKVAGGGISAQASAIRLGISRALLLMDADLRPTLKKAGFLTRDARQV